MRSLPGPFDPGGDCRQRPLRMTSIHLRNSLSNFSRPLLSGDDLKRLQ